jgi:hypothetical protein
MSPYILSIPALSKQHFEHEKITNNDSVDEQQVTLMAILLTGFSYIKSLQ